MRIPHKLGAKTLSDNDRKAPTMPESSGHSRRFCSNSAVSPSKASFNNVKGKLREEGP